MSDHQPAAHPALVVCDFQTDVLGRLGKEAPHHATFDAFPSADAMATSGALAGR